MQEMEVPPPGAPSTPDLYDSPDFFNIELMSMHDSQDSSVDSISTTPSSSMGVPTTPDLSASSDSNFMYETLFDCNELLELETQASTVDSSLSSAPSFSSDLLNISQQDILGFMDTFDKLDDAGIFEEIDKIEDI